MSQKQKIIEAYKQKDTVESFDRERSKYAFQKYKHKIEANFLKKTIGLLNKRNIKILDVGCGTGRMLSEIFSVGKKVRYAGLDTSREMTAHLMKKAKNLDVTKNIKIKISDASKLPFKDEEFDIVFTYHLLWHLPTKEQEKMISEMLRVCKKGGFVIFDILNKNFIWEKFKKIIGKEKTGEIYKLSVKDVKKIIGMKNERIDMEKLSDAPLKNDLAYKLFNVINHLRNILPQSLYHMVYFRVRK